MSIQDRVTLLRRLKYMNLLDQEGASPYVGVDLVSDDLGLYRSGNIGFIKSVDANTKTLQTDWTWVSLSHIQECLRLFTDANVELTKDKAGILTISNPDGVFKTEIKIHTVGAAQSPIKAHVIGTDAVKFDHTWLGDIDIRALELVSPPVLDKGVMRFCTNSGTVFYGGAAPTLDPKVSPREATIRAISAVNPEMVVLSDKGYYKVRFDGMEMAAAGHNLTPAIFAAHVGPTDKDGFEYGADRFLQALKAAVTVAAPGSPIKLTSQDGFISMNQWGSLNKFALGKSKHPSFELSFGVGELLQVLGAGEGEIITVQQIALSKSLYRFIRGNYEVNVRLTHV